MFQQGKQTVFSKLNLDSHNLLLEQRDLVYLLNGDIQCPEDGNNSLFVQNQLSNEVCVSFPTGYTYNGGIKLDNNEYAVFLKGSKSDQIGLVNLTTCSYDVLVDSSCLSFNLNNPVRGVYKRLNSTNERVIYFIDGLNYNRYLNIDKALIGDFPKTSDQSDCKTCGITVNNELDCDKLRMNKPFRPPCITVDDNRQGSFSTGTYQVGIAYSEDGLVFTDYFFSPIHKVQSYKEDIGFSVDIACVYSPFPSYNIILVSQTKEGSLIVYDFGHYSQGVTKVQLTSTSNATVIDTVAALSKRTFYDKSSHITTNEETLLLGKHSAVEPLEYQPFANQIEVEWLERKIQANKAHLFPTFMRDEVYDFSIVWRDENGTKRGQFHIPGRQIDNNWSIIHSGSTFHENDIPTPFYLPESTEPCPELPMKIWQVQNTAYITESYTATCEDCNSDIIVTKAGKMGYYECQDITYPDEDRWGGLRCSPVRRHRMPSSDLTHIHNNGNCVTETKSYMVYDEELGYEVEQFYDVTNYVPDGCVNLLGVRLKNVPIPEIDGEFVNNWTYELHYSDREGNKSILHKGLVYNVNKEVDGNVEIMYPNYPYNDLNPDQYLSKVQTNESTSGNPNHDKANLYYKNRFTYLSPNTEYKETQNEFGSSLQIYTEEIGKVKGQFEETYRHPKVAIHADDPDTKTSFGYARQFNSAAHYESYVPYALPKDARRLITQSQWLLPIKQLVKGNRFNNEMRETSYFFEVEKDITNPTNVDVSRVTMGDIGCTTQLDFCKSIDIWGGVKPIQAVSYYVGIKNYQPNQYGNLSQIKYKPVDSCAKRLPSIHEGVIDQADFFGGDVYISRHSFFRKMPLFSEWLYDVPYNTEYNYRDKRNVWYPVYWFDNLTDDIDKYRLSCIFSTLGVKHSVLGYFYTWVTGNSYFWCESEFIGDYREIDSRPNTRFYPKVDFNEVAKADNIRLQPQFVYDFSLLKNHIEDSFLSNYTKSDAAFTVSYSVKNDLQSSGDNWLKFLPLNYTILPQIYGEFTGLHYVDQYSIFFSFENMILYSQEDYTLITNQGNSIFLGQGDIFSKRLRKLSNESTGYTGCIDPFSFINTRFGTFYFDRLRKKFFQWTGQLKELTGISSWLNQFSDPNENPNRYKDSMIVTFDNYTNNLYFTDKINNWTISYKPSMEGFISFHSFVPDFYLTMQNSYASVKGKLWKHNVLNSYNRYYNTPYLFDVGFTEISPEEIELQSIEVDTEFIKTISYLEREQTNLFFDQVLVFNNQTSTGILDTVLKNKDDRTQSLIQNKDLFNTCEVSHLKGSTFSINKLENNLLPLKAPFNMNAMSYNALNIIKKDPKVREDIKGKWFRIHLRSINKENLKIILRLNNTVIDKINR